MGLRQPCRCCCCCCYWGAGFWQNCCFPFACCRCSPCDCCCWLGWPWAGLLLLVKGRRGQGLSGGGACWRRTAVLSGSIGQLNQSHPLPHRFHRFDPVIDSPPSPYSCCCCCCLCWAQAPNHLLPLLAFSAAVTAENLLKPTQTHLELHSVAPVLPASPLPHAHQPYCRCCCCCCC